MDSKRRRGVFDDPSASKKLHYFRVRWIHAFVLCSCPQQLQLSMRKPSRIAQTHLPHRASDVILFDLLAAGNIGFLTGIAGERNEISHKSTRSTYDLNASG